ncbi:hypothetical protein V1227_05880 [Lentzea sp. DG1S-22]|uniref:hypothetical protein n=1 Tax=Lentzea sp. DG1S-22 TaxID=3108822 RepID=UPI002E760FDB|nr:hypothetical protein [Lentzea sp. DG1S-22]WVH82288.1 hypothetical protein V1227_05880 [Lentzea sp. DG1S-22]
MNDRHSGPRTLAEKVDHLFREVHPRDRKPFTHPEVAKATGLSTGLLSALRSGKNVNPTKDTLTTSVHQAHIVLQELGHILCDHPGSEPVDLALSGVFPDLSATTLEIMLARHHAGFSAEHETEAETVAYLISELLDARPRRAGDRPPGMGGRLGLAME